LNVSFLLDASQLITWPLVPTPITETTHRSKVKRSRQNGVYCYNALHMPASSTVNSVLDQQLLQQLGARLKSTRLNKKLTAGDLAIKAGISRMTLGAVESGAATPTMGTYLRVMSALGVSTDIALIASTAMQSVSAPNSPVGSQSVTIKTSGASTRHQIQDLQSLMLHKEAVDLMKKNPALIDRAFETLKVWRSGENSRSSFLWDEWAVILHRKAWRRALSMTRRGQELRQASPIATILPPEVRQKVLDQIQQLKEGVVLGTVILPSTGPSNGQVS
jgi:transcriptional regulator with XRE-family HTH domain